MGPGKGCTGLEAKDVLAISHSGMKCTNVLAKGALAWKQKACWFGSKRCAGNKLSWYEGHWFGYIAIDSQKRTQEIVYFSAGKQTHAQNWACENIKRDLYPQTCRFLGIF